MRSIKLPIGQSTKTDNYTRICEDMYVIETQLKQVEDDEVIDTALNHLGHEKCKDFDYIINKFWKSGKLTFDERNRIIAMIKLLYCDYYRV